jgi:hypothetical protein
VYENVARAKLAARTAEQPHDAISCVYAADRRARLIGPAAPVNFAGCNSGNTNLRALGTPDRPIAVVDGGWRAPECLTGRHNRRSRFRLTHDPAEQRTIARGNKCRQRQRQGKDGEKVRQLT